MISTGGSDYYNNLFKELQSKNIAIIADLYHYDMPVIWQNLGGWTNATIIDAFEGYARNCFDLFGEYVSVWMPLAAPLREVGSLINCFLMTVLSFFAFAYVALFFFNFFFLSHIVVYHVFLFCYSETCCLLFNSLSIDSTWIYGKYMATIL